MGKAYINNIMELKFNDYYSKIISDIETTNINMVILGYAGSGKSTLLKYIVDRYKKTYAVLAPTGIAALNVGGETIHSFFKFPPRFIDYSAVKNHSDGEIGDMIKSIDTFIIDEISMVRADLFDGIDLSMRLAMDNDLPFGGKQIICFGDLSQLPPIVTDDDRDFINDRYQSPYFFDSTACWNYKFVYKLLTHNYRQNNDETFVNILNRMRNGKTSFNDIDIINTHCHYNQLKSDIDSDYTANICSTNRLANSINDKKLFDIDQPSYTFEATIVGDFNTKNCVGEEIITLKKGAKIMMLNNTDVWANGSIGIVDEIGVNHIKVDLGYGSYEVNRYEWKSIKYIKLDNGSVIPSVTGTMYQYPIKLAYASTIHKFQGKQADKLVVDLTSKLFTHGHLYVALSRCTTMDGIYITRPITMKDISTDNKVISFMEDVYEIV